MPSIQSLRLPQLIKQASTATAVPVFMCQYRQRASDMRYLRTNTAIRLTVGPFLDKTDGITPEVAITVTSDKLTLVVDDGNVPTLVLDVAPTASGGANDMVHITGDDSGYYDLELAAANVNYVGRALLSLNDVATHCPVFHEFMILPAVIYDSLVLGTDLFDVSATQILGTAVSTPATAGVLDVNVKNIDNDAASASGTVTFPNATLASTTNITAGTVAVATAVTTVNGLAASVITAASIASDAITAAKIADGAIDAATFAAGAINAAAIAADAITDAKVASDVTIASVTGAVGSVAGNVTGSIGSLAAQAKADVNAEVVDTLNVDTYAEPGQEAPAATNTLVKKIGYLYKAWRNKKDQTATTQKLYADDASTVDQKATVSDDGTTFVSGEIGTGP